MAVWRGEGSPVYREIRTTTLPRFLAWAPVLDPDETSPRMAAGGLEIWRIAAVGGESERLAMSMISSPPFMTCSSHPMGARWRWRAMG